MKAVIFTGVGDIKVADVPDPVIENPTDAIVKITSTAICGTDLHMIRGTMGPMKSGTILGHEGVGIVEQVGNSVRNFKPGDRVVIASTIACGNCSYCRSGYYSQCDNANPNGKNAGTAFFGGPIATGSFNGLQAEKALIPFAHVGMVRLPDSIPDDQAVLLSDVFPTGYFGAKLAEIKHGDTVAIYGCGPVGQFAIMSAFYMGAGRIFAIDHVEERLEMASLYGAEIINFDKEDPVDVIMSMTGGVGVDRIIDAVGVDAQKPSSGPAAAKAAKLEQQFKNERAKVAPQTNIQGDNWVPGNAPTQALQWALETIDKAGTLSIIGVYPSTVETFPIGKSVHKNLTIKMGNCNHRRYIPELINLMSSKLIDLKHVVTKKIPFTSVIEAYKEFDKRHQGWVKVELVP